MQVPLLRVCSVSISRVPYALGDGIGLCGVSLLVPLCHYRAPNPLTGVRAITLLIFAGGERFSAIDPTGTRSALTCPGLPDRA